MSTRTSLGRTVLSVLLSVALALQCVPAVAEPTAEEPMGEEVANGATARRTSTQTPAQTSARNGESAEAQMGEEAPAPQGQPTAQAPAADAPLPEGPQPAAPVSEGDPSADAALAPDAKAAPSADVQTDGALATESETEGGAIEAQAVRPVLHAQAHVQDRGWMAPVSGRFVSVGTEHESRRVEALRLWVTGASGAIEGKVHVQDIGWKDWQQSSASRELGTQGLSKRVEALRLRLSANLASAGWHLYYRLHVQDLGWLGWARDGELAGTAGYAKRAEKIELRLVGPGESGPGVGGAFVTRGFTGTGHVQDIGWQPERSGTRFSVGTSRQSRRVEAITLNRPSDDRVGSVVYEAHVQNVGWQGERRNGQAAGTSGQSLRVEAIRVWLTGEFERDYDVWYRVHAQDVGWMGWTKNGAKAGTQGFGRRLEAVEFAFLPKGSSTPSAPDQATSQPFMETDPWTYAIPGGTFTMPGPWRGKLSLLKRDPMCFVSRGSRVVVVFSGNDSRNYDAQTRYSGVRRTYRLGNGGALEIAGAETWYYGWKLTMPNGRKIVGYVSDGSWEDLSRGHDSGPDVMSYWRGLQSSVTGLPASGNQTELTFATIRVVAEHVRLN